MVGLLAAAALLVGCSDGGDEAASAPEPAAAAASGSAGGEGGSRDSSGAGVDSVDVGEVLVEQVYEHPDNPEDEVTLGVVSLTVEGEVMVLRLAMTPRLASASDSSSISQFKALGEELFRPTLVDAENLKEYSVIKQNGGSPWQTKDLELKTVNGGTMLAWAYFAAPEDDIDTIDLRLSDNVPAFTDIPITR